MFFLECRPTAFFYTSCHQVTQDDVGKACLHALVGTATIFGWRLNGNQNKNMSTEISVSLYNMEVEIPLLSSNKCIASSNKCLTSSNKKLLGAPGHTSSSKNATRKQSSREPCHPLPRQ